MIEEFLDGEEASFFALLDGAAAVALASAQDHKAACDGDTGPNTGGMGAYSPAPVVTPEMEADVMERIVLPTARAMVAEGAPFRGVLFAGLMIKDGKVCLFICLFGLVFLCVFCACYLGGGCFFDEPPLTHTHNRTTHTQTCTTNKQKTTIRPSCWSTTCALATQSARA